MEIWIRSQDKTSLVECKTKVFQMPQGATAIYMDTLKAINQQCKELGWI